MTKTFFFYDLETSGLSARNDRVMQFAGRRTDENLNNIGEPYNILVKLNDDTIPSPEALMVTGITPQKTLEEGYSEAEFANILANEIFTPDTVAIGFNNIRFDDEFVRHLFWRNFHDPYEWAYKDGRSRWDLLDAVRMTRALRPEGINWPVNDKGQPTNRLELITKQNGIVHANAHDALSDVDALIDVTRLIKTKQPRLFEYLLQTRNKKDVQNLINLQDKKPFVYTSGRYDSEWNKTTVAFPMAPAQNNNVLVYDLRFDPTEFIGLSVPELSKRIFANYEERKKDDFVKVPIKVLQYNRCPAVAPINVLSQSEGWQKLGLNQDEIDKNIKIILDNPDFSERLRSVYEVAREFPASNDPEAQLYDGFVNDRDKLRIETVRNASETQLADFHPEFSDSRLDGLLLHYKARNFPSTLSDSEASLWEKWRSDRIHTQMVPAVKSLQKLSVTADDSKQFVLQELQLWIESIVPITD